MPCSRHNASVFRPASACSRMHPESSRGQFFAVPSLLPLLLPFCGLAATRDFGFSLVQFFLCGLRASQHRLPCPARRQWLRLSFARPFRRLPPRRALDGFTRPYTPRPDGKAERFIQTALRERPPRHTMCIPASASAPPPTMAPAIVRPLCRCLSHVTVSIGTTC
jgi:hypothetical protein